MPLIKTLDDYFCSLSREVCLLAISESVKPHFTGNQISLTKKKNEYIESFVNFFVVSILEEVFSEDQRSQICQFCEEFAAILLEMAVMESLASPQKLSYLPRMFLIKSESMMNIHEFDGSERKRKRCKSAGFEAERIGLFFIMIKLIINPSL